MTANVNVSLNDQIKNFLVGLLKGAAADLKRGCVPILSNVAVAALIMVPCAGIVIGGEFLADKMTPAGSINPGATALACGSILICQFGAMACYLGLLSTFVKVARGAKTSMVEVVHGHGKIWSLLGAQLLIAPLFLLGFILLIIPGFYIALRASLVPLLIADEDAGPIEAIKRSFELTRGREFEIALLLATFVISNYVVAAASALLGLVLPVVAGLSMFTSLLLMQFILTRYYVSTNPGADSTAPQTVVVVDSTTELPPIPCVA